MAIADIFGGAGNLFAAQGDYQASKLFGEAAQVGETEEAIEAASGRIQEQAAKRQEFQAIGQNVGAAGANNESLGGSNWDVIRMSQAQGAIQNQVIGTNTAIQEEGTQLQVISAEAQAAEAEAAGNAAMASGIGGILSGAGILGFLAFSDRRLKRKITFIGWHNGFPFYRFKFWWSRKWHIGVMAQDLLEVEPEMCKRHWTGFWMVDYGKVLNA